MENETATARYVEWASKELGRVVSVVTQAGALDKAVVEARPAWAFPPQVLIGKLRERGDADRFFWVIGGEMPPDHIGSEVAATPREAARHFAMKWQLEAARLRDPASRDKLDHGGDWKERSETLERHAVSLYGFAADDRLWQSEPPS